MRLRKIKNVDEILTNSKYFIDISSEPKKMNNLISNSKILNIEIGMGKGQFIYTQALNHPNINFIGIELNRTVCAKAIKKIETSELLNNLIIINLNAINLTNLFPKHSIDKIYLNFSDPWPKKRHIKNRLTNPRFLEIYEQILKPDGIIEFKTDNDNLFNYTYDVINELKHKIRIIYFTTNLYEHLDEEINRDNVATEYETKFHQQNKNIYKIVFEFI